MEKMTARGAGRASLALAFALTVAPLPALAEGDVSAEAFDWNQFWDYTSCAMGIATLETPSGAFMAVISCGRVITRYLK